MCHPTFVSLYAAPSVTITANLNNMPLMVGQTGIILTYKISGADNLNSAITYQWTRNNGTTQISIGTNLNTLSLPPLQLSDAGFYSCRVTSALLNNPVTANTSVIIQGKLVYNIKIMHLCMILLFNSSRSTTCCSH